MILHVLEWLWLKSQQISLVLAPLSCWMLTPVWREKKYESFIYLILLWSFPVSVLNLRLWSYINKQISSFDFKICRYKVVKLYQWWQRSAVKLLSNRKWTYTARSLVLFALTCCRCMTLMWKWLITRSSDFTRK